MEEKRIITIDWGSELQLTANPSKEKEKGGLFQSKELDVQVLLGEQLDTAKTNAKLEEGVLTVTIPVSAKAKGRSIKISWKKS